MNFRMFSSLKSFASSVLLGTSIFGVNLVFAGEALSCTVQGRGTATPTPYGNGTLSPQVKPGVFSFNITFGPYQDGFERESSSSSVSVEAPGFNGGQPATFTGPSEWDFAPSDKGYIDSDTLRGTTSITAESCSGTGTMGGVIVVPNSMTTGDFYLFEFNNVSITASP